jgi:hypothetical protein
LCLVYVAAFHGAAWAASSSPLPETKIIKFEPSSVSTTEEKEGTCWTPSIAVMRPDAWRCMVGNEIFDPCFEIEGAEGVLCGADPAEGKPGFRLNLTEPLPGAESQTNSPPAPHNGGWLVQLEDGTLCSPVTGASGLLDGKIITYYCKSRQKGVEVSLLGDLDASSPLWTAEKATYSLQSSGPKLLRSQRVPVKTVWQ